MALKQEIQAKIVETLHCLIPELKTAKDAMKIKISREQLETIKDVFSSDALELIRTKKLANINESKSFTEILHNFFGMSKNWNIGRNLLGGFMVHAPEYPTYFIPAYTQAKATGSASELKKGEGPRGLITGMLEGVAVGALVSGEKLKFKEMGPYIILGAALQMFSCTVFPIIGEKLGQHQYKKHHKNCVKPTQANTQIVQPNTKQPETTNLTGKLPQIATPPQFKSFGMRI